MSDTLGSGNHPALTDHETGLPNRLHFDTVFEVLFATGRRGVPLTVMVLEVEGYRDWVTNSDPSTVSREMKAIGATMKPVVRETDLVARTDEARFTIFLLDCNLAGAVLVADRMDALLSSVRDSAGLGFSIGGASFNRDMERPEDMLTAAERALGEALARGPNQMEFHR